MPILTTQLRNISVLKNKILNFRRKIVKFVLVQAICVWNISKVCSYKYNVIAIYALTLDFLRDILILKQNFKNIILSYHYASSFEAVPYLMYQCHLKILNITIFKTVSTNILCHNAFELIKAGFYFFNFFTHSNAIYSTLSAKTHVPPSD